MTETAHVLSVRLGCFALVVWSAAAGCSASEPAPVSPEIDASVDAGADEAANDSAAPPDACSAPKEGDRPCDVAAVLAICQNCHQRPPLRMAPFPLMSYEDTQAVYFGPVLIATRMSQVIEPNDPVHMPPRAATDIPQPTDAELDTLRAWFRACTPPEPEGQGCDKGEADAP
jgi:hypothetical protein